MKIVLPYFISLLFILTSCKDRDSARDSRSETDPGTEYSTENNAGDNGPGIPDNTGTTSENGISGDTSTTSGAESTQNTATPSAGNYIKLGEESDSSCKCYCLDINFSSNSELCLSRDRIYISVRYEDTGNDLISVFLVDPVKTNTEGNDFPWENFDRNTPIAAITSSNGEIDFDWLGFSIDGELAIDYAIYGKKTLEGRYIKK